VDPISVLANYAAVGALLASALVLLSGDREKAPEWILKGTVIGGGFGLALLIWRGVS
jgi:hypothetical protein